MTSLPTRMADRWESRPEPDPGQAQLYWHILMSDQPQVRALAAVARRRLTAFPDLHFTPEPRLHLSVLRVGLSGELTAASVEAMAGRARDALTQLPPAEFTLGPVFYAPEAIALAAEPSATLDEIGAAIRRAAAGTVSSDPAPAWIPHVTVAYSTADQPAAPIISALGHELPSCPVSADRLHLIAQYGPERAWNWQSLATITLSGRPQPA